MVTLKNAMEAGFTEFVNVHRATPSTKLTLVEFDLNTAEARPFVNFTTTGTVWYTAPAPVAPSILNVVYDATPIEEVGALNLQPRGWTPLYDALAMTIDNTGKRLAALPESDRPRGVIFVVITDGYENASRTYSKKDVFDRVTHQTNKYNWEFVYLGANQDAIGVGASLGIPFNKSIDFGTSYAGAQSAMAATATSTYAYTASIGAGENANLASTKNIYTKAQRVSSAGEDDALLKKATTVTTSPTSTTT